MTPSSLSASRTRLSTPGALLLALFVAAPLAGQTATLPRTDDAVDAIARGVESVIEASPRDRAHWGILVHDPVSGRDLYARNADRLFVPASNLKLVVTAAAAHYLDPGFRYATTLYGTGPVRDGVLEGDLVVYGRGDPTISGRYYDGDMDAVFEALADSLSARGVRRVAGRVVADASYFDSTRVHPDWEAYDLLWWYAAPVASLGFNDNSVDFRIEPGAVGEPAAISWEPRTSHFEFVNRTRTVRSGGAHTLDFVWIAGTDSVLAYGTVPADARSWVEYFAMGDPPAYAATVLRETLERRGIRIDHDDVRVIWDPARSVLTPGGRPVEGVQRLTEWHSVPLDRLVFPILNSSQNWFAEQMLKTVGREVSSEGSWRAGIELERRFLTEVVGIEPEAFDLRDASGLSSGNLITPRALARLLVHMRGQPLAYEAMPVAGGESGSLRYRLTDLRGRVRAKTGGIRNVDTLSGYLTTDGGRELVFVVMANGAAFSDSRGALDDVVRAITRGAP